MKKFWNKLFNIKEEDVFPSSDPDSSKIVYLGDGWSPIEKKFDGEKTAGELGPVLDLIPDHINLRARSYSAYLKEDIIKTIASRFFTFTIGKGLILKCDVEEDVLKSEGVKLDESFSDLVETRFKIFAKSKFSDFSRMQDLHEKAKEAFSSAFLGGDCLVICRIENNIPNVQIIDGQRVKNPRIGSPFYEQAKNRGNKIIHGIEVSKRGEHVAFYLDTEEAGVSQRIQAKGEKTGRLMAWIVYGEKARIDHLRGIPATTAILEKVSKLGRYSEAIVGSAEERAKIPFTIEHDKNSTGENPMQQKIAQKVLGSVGEAVDPFKYGNTLSDQITATTGKEVYNLPIGSKMTSLESKQESNFDEFFNAVFVQICSAMGVPPEVAKQMYNSNYSASRASIKAWDFVVEIVRDKFSKSFYKPIYEIWLETEILKDKIPAYGFIEAIQTGNFMVIEAYAGSRFSGPKMPHIDPLKEINAIRAMLGEEGKNIPLIDPETAVEVLDNGNFWEISTKFKKSKKEIDGTDSKDQ